MILFLSFCPISPAEVRSLWAQLRHDEPHLLANFEDFLARVTSQIIEANQEKREMESALKRSGGFLYSYQIVHYIIYDAFMGLDGLCLTV